MVRPKKSNGQNQFRFRKIVLGFTIGIIFTLFIMYGIKTFHEEPRYDKFCDQSKYPVYPGAYPKENDSCAELMRNVTTPTCPFDVGYIEYRYDKQSGCSLPICETCAKEYDRASEAYNNKVFIISIIAGAIALVAGVIVGVEAVGSGLMFGGALTIIVGTIRNWGQLGDFARFAILGLVLAALIWIGYKKLQD